MSAAPCIAALDWSHIESELNTLGHARLERLLDRRDCDALIALWADPARFRSQVIMARHGFGRGEYRYFAAPLPERIVALREALYPPLAAIANRWSVALGLEDDYPAAHGDYRRRCHAAGQTQPTPLLLRYEAGDFNCLHQDLYGEHVFPLQMAFLLSQPEQDFSGGEFVITEQRPRAQSRVEVVPLSQGDAVLFPVRHRPAQGARGTYRVQARHGVSRIRRGNRCTLGIIFHDAA